MSGKWIRGSLMLEGSPCPGEVREAMPVTEQWMPGREASRRDDETEPGKHLNWKMPERCFDVRPSEKDLPFCLVLHHMYGESWPSLSRQHRPLGDCAFTCIHFCSPSFPLRASRHRVPDGWFLESSFGTPYVF